MIRAILLDAAGTLIEPAEPVARTYARILARHGLDFNSILLAPAFREAFARASEPDYSTPDGEAAERAWWRKLVDDTLHRCGGTPVTDEAFGELFRHYARPEAWVLFPEVRETLRQAAARGLRLAVVSNFDHRLHPILQGHDLAGHFDFILTSSEARARKPAPLIFRQALDRLGLPVGEVVHFGDSESADLAGAAAAGIRGFLVRRPEHDLLHLLARFDHDA